MKSIPPSWAGCGATAAGCCGGTIPPKPSPPTFAGAAAGAGLPSKSASKSAPELGMAPVAGATAGAGDDISPSRSDSTSPLECGAAAVGVSIPSKSPSMLVSDTGSGTAGLTPLLCALAGSACGWPFSVVASTIAPSFEPYIFSSTAGILSNIEARIELFSAMQSFSKCTARLCNSKSTDTDPSFTSSLILSRQLLKRDDSFTNATDRYWRVKLEHKGSRYNDSNRSMTSISVTVIGSSSGSSSW
mmetsp:Transcript_10770/g.39563  ORF Transcript_10770/g.39563 Transcript_10770/m.39563 type:complete len:245 (+) Transcript_10770:1570-2304(+)